MQEHCCDATCTNYGGPRRCGESVQLSAGASHSLFLRLDGVALAAGSNQQGELGDGTSALRAVPKQLSSLTGEVQAVQANGHSLFLLVDGTAWAVGPNDHGQLGDGTQLDRRLPVQVLTGVIAVAAGLYHSIFLRSDGRAWSSGQNFYGQLGDGTTDDRAVPVQVLRNVRAISAGGGHTLFLRSDGTAWAAGWNQYGQLGDGTNTDSLIPVQVLAGVRGISAGNQHSIFLRTDGTAWAAGYNHVGQLGDGTTEDRRQAVQVLAGVLAASAGTLHTLFLKTDYTAWATGYNFNGQLGDGTKYDRSSPVLVLNSTLVVAAGESHSLFLRRDGTAWAAGGNGYGQLGDGTQADSAVPKQIIDLWPLPTTTTTTSFTTTSTRTTSAFFDACAHNVFPDPGHTFSAANLPQFGDLFSAAVLAPVFSNALWATGEVWTLSFRVSSTDTVPRLFAMVGGQWFFSFVVPPGMDREPMYVQDTVAYMWDDARIEYVGTGTVGNVSFSQVFMGPGICNRPLDYNTLSFNYEVGSWGACLAKCGIDGVRKRSVLCRGSDGKVYTQDWACATFGPAENISCTGDCGSMATPPYGGLSLALLISAIVVPTVAVLLATALCCWSRRRYRKRAAVQLELQGEAITAPEPPPAPKPAVKPFPVPPGGRHRGKRKQDEYYGGGPVPARKPNLRAELVRTEDSQGSE